MKYQEALDYLMEFDLGQMVRVYQEEYLEWKRTGILQDGVIRNFYNILSEDGTDHSISVVHAEKFFNEYLAELLVLSNADSLTKEQALKAMRLGMSITHRLFTSDEFLKMEDGMIKDEQGYNCGTVDDMMGRTEDVFWSERRGELWEDGWWVID